MGAGAVVIGALVLFIGRHTLQGHLHVEGSAKRREAEADLLAVGDLD